MNPKFSLLISEIAQIAPTGATHTARRPFAILALSLLRPVAGAVCFSQWRKTKAQGPISAVSSSQNEFMFYTFF